MLHRFSRTEMIIGSEGLAKLAVSKVAVFGVGGVGSFVVEALCRAGVGNFILVDNDSVSLTNINRQVIATDKTLGQPKVDVMKERIHDINPDAVVKTYQTFYLTGDPDGIIDDDTSYIVDAIDTVTGKIGLVLEGIKKRIPVISSMGTGNKLDPTKIEVSDIYKTSVCPLARVMRRELKLRGVKKLKVVFSTEEPVTISENVSAEDYRSDVCNDSGAGKSSGKNNIPGSVSFVPPVAGMIIASEVVKDLLKK